MVFAATAWHWLDPSLRFGQAAQLLKPGGILAIVTGGHAFPENFDPFFNEIQECYNAIGLARVHWPPPPPERAPDERASIEGCGLFEIVAVNHYLWTAEYTAKEYVDLLNTYPDHRALNPPQRESLLSEIERRIDARPFKRVRKHYLTILHVARCLRTSPIHFL